MNARPARLRRGFTLIEILAVMLIIGLIAGFALPNLGLRSQRALEHQARRIAADVEFVRQRAVMTSTPQRLVFDLDNMDYWVETWGTDPMQQTPPTPAAVPEGEAPLPMAAPRDAISGFHRPLGTLGDVHHLDDAIFIDGIETGDGLFDRGELQMFFASDGTTDPTWIVLADDGGNAITLEVEPLADTVRFEYGQL